MTTASQAFELEEKEEEKKKVWYIHELDKAGHRVRTIAAFYVYRMAEKTLAALNKDGKSNDEIDDFLDYYDKLLRKLADY